MFSPLLPLGLSFLLSLAFAEKSSSNSSTSISAIPLSSGPFDSAV